MNKPSAVTQGRKGRPIGFKLSEASKRAISEAKKGQRHKNSTKDKISRSLQNYFRKKNPWSEELVNTYCRVGNDELCEWMYNVSDDLDNFRDVLTIKALYNKLRIEVSYGNNIEEIFSHSMTPELLLMFKQEMARRAEEGEINEDDDRYEGEIS